MDQEYSKDVEGPQIGPQADPGDARVARVLALMNVRPVPPDAEGQD